ncbi:MAG TPA: hypothetical protein VLH84_05090 [Patescibacteria group bacterium]|nr:hypothetical protein [Patescibacteria group bacterium]
MADITSRSGVICATTEAAALANLGEEMSRAAVFLRSYGSRTDENWALRAEALGHDTAVIGVGEMDSGVSSIAGYLLDLLSAPPIEEVFVPVNPDKSSLFMYVAVKAALAELNTDTSDRLIGFHSETGLRPSDQVRKRMQVPGSVAVINDWSVTGTEGRLSTGLAARIADVSRQDVQALLVCTPREQALEGFAGAACRAHFVYDGPSRNEERPTLLGNHSDAIIGFMDLIQRLYMRAIVVSESVPDNRAAQELYAAMEYPVFYRIARSYRPAQAQQALTPEQALLFDTRRAKHVVAARGLVQLANL